MWSYDGTLNSLTNLELLELFELYDIVELYLVGGKSRDILLDQYRLYHSDLESP